MANARTEKRPRRRRSGAKERAHQLGVAERERALLREFEHALAKLDVGTDGVSEKTGDVIPYERLAAVPLARQAVDE